MTPPIDPADIRDRARQGDPAAIATLLNQGLQAKQIKAQVKRQDNVLLMRLLCSTAPNPNATVGWIVQNLRKLQPEGITQVKIQAQVPNAAKPAWGKAATLAASTPAPSPATPAANPFDAPADSPSATSSSKTEPANPFDATGVESIDASVNAQSPSPALGEGFRVRATPAANPFDEPVDSVTDTTTEPANPFDEPIAEPIDTSVNAQSPSPALGEGLRVRATPAANPFDEPIGLTDDFVMDSAVSDAPRSPATTTQLQASATVLQPTATVKSSTRSPSPAPPPRRLPPQPDTWLPLHWEWAIVNTLFALTTTFVTPIARSRLLLVLSYAGLAYLQTCIMARRLAKPAHWGIATFAGALLPFGTLGSGVGQWIVLRQMLPDASRWLVVNLITGMISLVLFFLAGVAAFGGSNIGLLILMAILAGWAIYIAGTTFVLWQLLGREPERLPSPPTQPIAYLSAFFQRPQATPLPTEPRSRPSSASTKATARRVAKPVAQPSPATDTATTVDAAFATPPTATNPNVSDQS